MVAEDRATRSGGSGTARTRNRGQAVAAAAPDSRSVS